MKKIEELVEETLAWNNGNGVNIDAWISYEGNYNLALGYTSLLWPNFVEFEDYIFRDGFSEKSVRGFEAQKGSTKKSVECVINHIHISDIHNHENDKISVEKILYLGNVLKEIYESKLAWNFPGKPCTVGFYTPEDPDDLDGYQLTFWQLKHENA